MIMFMTQSELIETLNASYNLLLDDSKFCPEYPDMDSERIAQAVFEAARIHGLTRVGGSTPGHGIGMDTNIYESTDGIRVCGWYDSSDRDTAGFDSQVYDDE